MLEINYKSAGVDIDAGNETVKRIKQSVESTFSKNVLTDLGSFGALYDLKFILQEYQHPVLVQSIDGVGTKMMIAKQMQEYSTIGHDLVSATVNDIIVLGAKPLTLLDYIANDRLKPNVIEMIVKSIADSCREHHISLVGGETAEMPGTYLPGEHDLVGVVTGILDKEKAILGKDIAEGDVVLGFASSGLHTNGYSFARKLFFDVGGYSLKSKILGLELKLGEELLKPHINYLQPIQYLIGEGFQIKGMAHITGGGLIDNIPRILPKHLSVEIKKNSWPILPIFNVMQQLGRVKETEMYRTFNMGIGLIMIVSPQESKKIQNAILRDARDAGSSGAHFTNFALYEVGRVVLGAKDVRLI